MSRSRIIIYSSQYLCLLFNHLYLHSHRNGFLRLVYAFYQSIPSPSSTILTFSNYYCIDDVLKKIKLSLFLCRVLQPSSYLWISPPPPRSHSPSLLYRACLAKETLHCTANSERPFLLFRVVVIVVLAPNLWFLHDLDGSFIHGFCDIIEHIFRGIDPFIVEIHTNHHLGLDVFPFRRCLLLLRCRDNYGCGCSANFVQSFTTFSRQSSREPRFSSFRDAIDDIGEDIVVNVDALMESNNLDIRMCCKDYALHHANRGFEEGRNELDYDELRVLMCWTNSKLKNEMPSHDVVETIMVWVETRGTRLNCWPLHQNPSEIWWAIRAATPSPIRYCPEVLLLSSRRIDGPSPLPSPSSSPPSPHGKTKKAGLRNRDREAVRAPASAGAFSDIDDGLVSECRLFPAFNLGEFLLQRPASPKGRVPLYSNHHHLVSSCDIVILKTNKTFIFSNVLFSNYITSSSLQYCGPMWWQLERSDLFVLSLS